VIAGFIPKKHLYSVNHNTYEVVLRQEDAPHFQLIFSKTITATIAQLPVLNHDDFLKNFSKNPELQQRLEQSFVRLMEEYTEYF